jgi:hypothetical protein
MTKGIPLFERKPLAWLLSPSTAATKNANLKILLSALQRQN